MLETVAEVCGVSDESLKEAIRGRAGNWPRKLAAFWLVMRAGMQNLEVAAMLDMHPVRVSQAMRDIRNRRAKSSDFAEVFDTIEQKLLKASA